MEGTSVTSRLSGVPCLEGTGVVNLYLVVSYDPLVGDLPSGVGIEARSIEQKVHGVLISV